MTRYAICDYLLLVIAKKVYRIDQNLYILSAAIGKVLFERKPLGELFVKPKRPQNDYDNSQLTLWEDFFGQYYCLIQMNIINLGILAHIDAGKTSVCLMEQSSSYPQRKAYKRRQSCCSVLPKIRNYHPIHD